jgi:hypothetical protein
MPPLNNRLATYATVFRLILISSTPGKSPVRSGDLSLAAQTGWLVNSNKNKERYASI